ncbi:iron complex transport system substrate-binding protein [Paenibacillus sp. yr247]|uniref:iron-hydroxamate ABC transporter substrate-binding protein n=1 Tax=Paenibacillus sp. yr247 TaxID=1761880 RepID=UPI0008836E9E|nr:iron-hydroxamate ABC transporter substrate-binding protein [Paenibacillus sp. yr247]SDN94353.1 iron complex transport system substrate-binding protein [Paenibacillus sp. yr247]
MSTKKAFTKSLLLSSVVLLSTIALAACGTKTASTSDATPAATAGAAANTTAPAADKVVKDPFGHEVKVPAHPVRIIASYLEDPLIALGLKPAAQWSVANGTQEYLKDKLQGVPTIEYNLPPEKVLSFNPDIILIGSEGLTQNGLYDQYSKIAPTYVLGDATTQDWRKTLTAMGDLFNKKAEADKVLKDYDQKVADTKSKLQDVTKDKSAAILWLTQKQFYVVNGKVASGAILYGDLGIKMPDVLAAIPDAKAANWNPISLEKLAALNADYIFIVNSDKGQGDTLESPVWKALPAVKSGHVYEMSASSSWLYNGAIAGAKTMDDLVQALLKK